MADRLESQDGNGARRYDGAAHDGGNGSSPGTGAGAMLRLIRDGRASTRAELVALTGLARSTVAQRMDALLAQRLRPAAGPPSPPGAPPPRRAPPRRRAAARRRRSPSTATPASCSPPTSARHIPA